VQSSQRYQQPPYLNFHLHVLAPRFFRSPNPAFALTSTNRFYRPIIPGPVKLSNDGKVFVRLYSTPPRSGLSWSLFGGPARCTRSRHMTLSYTYALTPIEWITHRGTRVCPWFVLFCFMLGLLRCFLPLFCRIS
jgi:hypothetical protein